MDNLDRPTRNAERSAAPRPAIRRRDGLQALQQSLLKVQQSSARADALLSQGRSSVDEELDDVAHDDEADRGDANGDIQPVGRADLGEAIVNMQFRRVLWPILVVLLILAEMTMTYNGPGSTDRDARVVKMHKVSVGVVDDVVGDNTKFETAAVGDDAEEDHTNLETVFINDAFVGYYTNFDSVAVGDDVEGGHTDLETVAVDEEFRSIVGDMIEEENRDAELYQQTELLRQVALTECINWKESVRNHMQTVFSGLLCALLVVGATKLFFPSISVSNAFLLDAGWVVALAFGWLFICGKTTWLVYSEDHLCNTLLVAGKSLALSCVIASAALEGIFLVTRGKVARPTIMFRVHLNGMSFATVYGCYTCLRLHACSLVEWRRLCGALLAAALHLAFAYCDDFFGGSKEAAVLRLDEQAVEQRKA